MIRVAWERNDFRTIHEEAQHGLTNTGLVVG
jgi:hypothetical protein